MMSNSDQWHCTNPECHYTSPPRNEVFQCPFCPAIVAPDNPEHQLTVKVQKNWRGFKAECSCGGYRWKVSGCNGPGMRYCCAQLEKSFEKHVKEASE
jgi:hypothetical protein